MYVCLSVLASRENSCLVYIGMIWGMYVCLSVLASRERGSDVIMFVLLGCILTLGTPLFPWQQKGVWTSMQSTNFLLSRKTTTTTRCSVEGDPRL